MDLVVDVLVFIKWKRAAETAQSETRVSLTSQSETSGILRNEYSITIHPHALGATGRAGGGECGDGRSSRWRWEELQVALDTGREEVGGATGGGGRSYRWPWTQGGRWWAEPHVEVGGATGGGGRSYMWRWEELQVALDTVWEEVGGAPGSPGGVPDVDDDPHGPHVQGAVVALVAQHLGGQVGRGAHHRAAERTLTDDTGEAKVTQLHLERERERERDISYLERERECVCVCVGQGDRVSVCVSG